MKNTFILSLTTAILILLSSNRELQAQDFYLWAQQDNSIIAKGKDKDGRKSGVYKYYDERKRLRVVGFFKDGIADSAWYYVENGLVREMVFLRNNKKNGPYQSYDERGLKISTSYFVDDVLWNTYKKRDYFFKLLFL